MAIKHTDWAEQTSRRKHSTHECDWCIAAKRNGYQDGKPGKQAQQRGRKLNLMYTSGGGLNIHELVMYKWTRNSKTMCFMFCDEVKIWWEWHEYQKKSEMKQICLFWTKYTENIARTYQILVQLDPSYHDITSSAWDLQIDASDHQSRGHQALHWRGPPLAVNLEVRMASRETQEEQLALLVKGLQNTETETN